MACYRVWANRLGCLYLTELKNPIARKTTALELMLRSAIPGNIDPR